MENKIKMVVYDDNSILIDTHPYKQSKTKRTILPSRNPRNSSNKPPPKYMTKRSYNAILKKTHKRLFGKILNINNPYWITFTLNNANKHLDEKEISQEFHKFIMCVSYHFGKPAYIRAIEYQNKSGLRLHIHALLSFKDKPKGFNRSYVKKHLWKLGNVKIKLAYDCMGLIEYITIFKEQNINPTDKNFTNFIRGSKIISMSNDFIIGQQPSNETLIDKETLTAILNQVNELEDNGLRVRVNQHYFYNDNTQQIQCCIDNVFIRNKKSR